MTAHHSSSPQQPNSLKKEVIMITHNDTCFSVLLDHEDINGYVDIAKFGVEAMVKRQLSRDLLQSMAEFIVFSATERRITFDPNRDPAELAASAEDGSVIEEIEAIEGQAVMTIQRLVSLEQAKKRRK